MVRSYLSKFVFLKFLNSNLRYIRHAIREGMWRSIFNTRKYFSKDKSINYLTWEIKLPTFVNSHDIKESFKSAGLVYLQGSHAYYLPPQEGLSKYLGVVVESYPVNAGFKILKDFNSPENSRYMANQKKSKKELLREVFTGKPMDQMITANYMHSLNIGPKIHDVCCLSQGNVRLTAFVVDHVEGFIPTIEQCDNFINELKKILKTSFLRMVIPDWISGGDYKCPDCNGNLIIENKNKVNRFNYVDFQNFTMTSYSDWTNKIINLAKNDLHFGNSRNWRSDSYLYQSIPGFTNNGKRNTDKRWELIKKCIIDSQVGFDKRLVLDVGCNSGMMIRNSLLSGAGWGFGWDTKDNVRNVNLLLMSLGCSRFNLFGGTLSRSYPIRDDIPKNFRQKLNDSIVFYLAIRHHIGVLDDLKKICWRIFIYEGAQKETLEQSLEFLEGLVTTNVKIYQRMYVKDGDSTKRPFIVLVRND